MDGLQSHLSNMELSPTSSPRRRATTEIHSAVSSTRNLRHSGILRSREIFSSPVEHQGKQNRTPLRPPMVAAPSPYMSPTPQQVVPHNFIRTQSSPCIIDASPKWKHDKEHPSANVTPSPTSVTGATFSPKAESSYNRAELTHKHTMTETEEKKISETTKEDTTPEPEAKRMKLTEPVTEAPDSEWPEAWLMTEEVEDQKALNKQEPNVPFSAADLRELGIAYWKMDADAFTYPIKSVPWDPKDAVDPRLSKIRDDRGYSYADIITVHPDHLPGYEDKVKSFFEEHIHDAEEIRYVLSGSGFFDVRDKKDRWVRVHVKKGDLMTLPEGIYHRFTTDETDMIHAMRLFVGQPIWTPFNRPCDDHPSRKKFVDDYLEEKKE